MSVKLHIKKGDMVQVIAGDNKGQQGKVLKVEAEKQRAIVEGVNLCKKATKPNAQNPQGGIVEKEAPIHVSNLQVLDPKGGKPTKVGRRLNAKGKLVRYAKKSSLFFRLGRIGLPTWNQPSANCCFPLGPVVKTVENVRRDNSKSLR